MRATGRFNDGLTAASRTVSVELEGRHLDIAELDGTGRWTWWLSSVRRVGEERRGDELILTTLEEPTSEQLGDARLVIPDAAFRAALFEAAPQLKGGRLRRRAIWRPAALSLLVAAGLVLFVAFGLRPAARAVAAAVPMSWEVSLGESAFRQILDYFAVLGGGEVEACVGEPGLGLIQGLTRHLAAQGGPSYPFHVVVLDHELNNAFALPGGRIVFFRGLIDFSQSPEEFAGVLSHEMAHVMVQHGVARVLEQFGLAILLDFVTGGGGIVTGSAALILGLSYSRDDEREADRLGIALLNRAGLESDGLPTFFERMAQERGGDDPFADGVGNLLSTHPADAERVESGRAAARPGRAAFTQEEWEAVQAICRQTRPVETES